jgi:ADP-ribosylglycohydrolase
MSFIQATLVRPEVLTIDQLRELDVILKRLVIPSNFSDNSYSELTGDSLQYMYTAFSWLFNFANMKRTEINSKYNYWDSKKRYFQRAATGSTTAKSFKEFGIEKAAELRVLNGIQISLKKTF